MPLGRETYEGGEVGVLTKKRGQDDLGFIPLKYGYGGKPVTAKKKGGGKKAVQQADQEVTE